jgi:hypothetical protein
MADRRVSIEVLPHQADLIRDVVSETQILVCGLGGGKTHGVVIKALSLAAKNWPVPGIVVEPTFPMVRKILVPGFEEFCTKQGIRYRNNKNEHVFSARLGGRWCKILLDSSDDPERLKGPNLSFAIMDEAGIHKDDVWRHLPARVRHPDAKVLQFIAVGTPEGFGQFYEWAEGPWDEKKRGRRNVIRAQTYDNVYLQPSPEEYVRRRLSHLDESDIDQYVRGLFVSRGSRAYRGFDRARNGMPLDAIGNGRIEVGADFNVGKCTWIEAVSRGWDEGHVFGEVTRYDTTTEEMGEALSKDIQERIHRRERRWATIEEVRKRTTIYADPSAKNRSTRAAESDVQQLKRMGYDVVCNHEPIPVKDRVMTVNWRFRSDKLWVDVAECPLLTKALEQQARDKNGAPEKNRDTQLDMSSETDALGYYVWGHAEWRASVPQGNAVTQVSYL